jgi:hypothetical protein
MPKLQLDAAAPVHKEVNFGLGRAMPPQQEVIAVHAASPLEARGMMIGPSHLRRVETHRDPIFEASTWRRSSAWNVLLTALASSLPNRTMAIALTP